MPVSIPTVDYHYLFRSLPGLYLLLAPDGTILDNSDEHVQVSMLPREEGKGRNIFDAYPSAPESQRALHESHEYVRRHRQPHTMPLTRYDLLRPAEEGGGFEERYWQITHYPILDPQGELLYILQRPQDVTAQHLAEQRQRDAERELAETRQQADFILENLPVLVTVTPPGGASSYFNRRWREFTGRSTEELLNNRFMELMHPQDLERIAAWRDEQMKAPSDTQVEFRMRRYDGVYRWMLARSISYFDPEGQLRLRVSTTFDIHDQKMLVEELLAANEQQERLADQAQQAYELAESQRRMFNDLFMQAPAMICILRGAEHRFEFVNPIYQSLFPDRELVGKTVAEAVPEVVEQGFLELLDHVYHTGVTFYGNEVPIILNRPDGSQRESYFNFSYQQYRVNNVPAGIIAFGVEVTDLVLARKKLEELYQAAGGSPESH